MIDDALREAKLKLAFLDEFIDRVQTRQYVGGQDSTPGIFAETKKEALKALEALRERYADRYWLLSTIEAEFYSSRPQGG